MSRVPFIKPSNSIESKILPNLIPIQLWLDPPRSLNTNCLSFLTLHSFFLYWIHIKRKWKFCTATGSTTFRMILQPHTPFKISLLGLKSMVLKFWFWRPFAKTIGNLKSNFHMAFCEGTELVTFNKDCLCTRWIATVPGLFRYQLILKIIAK